MIKHTAKVNTHIHFANLLANRSTVKSQYATTVCVRVEAHMSNGTFTAKIKWGHESCRFLANEHQNLEIFFFKTNYFRGTYYIFSNPKTEPSSYLV